MYLTSLLWLWRDKILAQRVPRCELVDQIELVYISHHSRVPKIGYDCRKDGHSAYLDEPYDIMTPSIRDSMLGNSVDDSID